MAAAGRLGEIGDARIRPAYPLPRPGSAAAPVRRVVGRPDPGAAPLAAGHRAGRVGPLDGVPAAYRDMANRLRLDEQRDELDRRPRPPPATGTVRELRAGSTPWPTGWPTRTGPRAYLLRLDPAGDGRAVVALGDPDRAANVLTHVPGMTADLASLGGELARAERVAVRAAELDPGASTSAVLWLDYDAPDFVDEAAGAGQAEAGARRAAPVPGGAAGHPRRAGRPGRPCSGTATARWWSGTAAARAGLAADERGLRRLARRRRGLGRRAARCRPVRSGRRPRATDVIQCAAVSPRRAWPADLLARPAGAGPLVGSAAEDDLWFGHNPSDPAFGARVFAQPAGRRAPRLLGARPPGAGRRWPGSRWAAADRAA